VSRAMMRVQRLTHGKTWFKPGFVAVLGIGLSLLSPCMAGNRITLTQVRLYSLIGPDDTLFHLSTRQTVTLRAVLLTK
jgi:hypothetical protein